MTLEAHENAFQSYFGKRLHTYSVRLSPIQEIKNLPYEVGVHHLALKDHQVRRKTLELFRSYLILYSAAADCRTI